MTDKKKNLQKAIISIAAVLGIGAILIFSSYMAYRTTVPDGFTSSEDGYIEIYTASDYFKFWLLAEDLTEPITVKGRLMADIYLNSTENYSDWISQPPENKCSEVYSFAGEFDGNGHTIYGLYSENGYGITKRNRGEIHDLTIKDSMITGNRYIGGICSYNNSVIRNCRFEGEIRSSKVDADSKCKMAGISVVNDGRIETCGYEGNMRVRLKWVRAGQRAGICTENYGEIINCYNLVSEVTVKEGACYGITDTGEENCYIMKNSGWQVPKDNQVWEISENQKDLIEAYLNRDVYTLYAKQDTPENWYEKKNAANSAGDLQDILSDKEQETSNVGMYDGQEYREITLKKALQDELLADFIFEAFLRKEMDFDDLTVREIAAGKGRLLFDVEAGWKGESLRVSSYLWPGTIRPDEKGSYSYGEIWTECSKILGEKDSESWQHDTWNMMDRGFPERVKGILILYSTQAGNQGFFYVTEGTIHRIEYDGTMEEYQFLSIKNRIEEYAFALAEEEEQEEEEPEDASEEQKGDSLWEVMLWQVWEDTIPGDGFSWKDANLKYAVYNQAAIEASLSSEGKVLSREELGKVESLEINESESISTLEDLTHLEGLKSLTIQNTEIGNADALSQMSQLTELYLINCGLYDISFVKGLPNLTHASFYGNALDDIGALAYCTELEELSLGCCNIQDISALAFNTELTELGLQGNNISDIEALRNLTNLTGLNLMSNNVWDVSPLSGLTNLEALGLANNWIHDISALSGLEKLYNLSLDVNEIEDISALKNMKEMKWLGLSNNRIEDFTPIQNYKNLFYLSVYNNPLQDIGQLVFTPDLQIGTYRVDGSEEMEQAQKLLNQVSQGQIILAEDIARGDLNGDGIADVAVTGISGQEKDETGSILDWGERQVYVFLGSGEGSLQLACSLETAGPDEGGIYGDPYQGITITGQSLVLQNYGGSNFRWAQTDIYHYENGGMTRDYSLSLNNWLGNMDGYDWYLEDEKQQTSRHYAVSGQREQSAEVLLLWDEAAGSAEKQMKQELEDKVAAIEREKGITLPEITEYFYKPDIDGGGYYYYEVHDPLYETKEDPAKVLEKVRDAYLDEAVAMPMTQYTTKEIKDNYDRLSGVVLPDVFYLGFDGEVPAILFYEGCMETEEGYVHMITVKEPTKDNEWWLDDITLYYRESTGTIG